MIEEMSNLIKLMALASRLYQTKLKLAKSVMKILNLTLTLGQR